MTHAARLVPCLVLRHHPSSCDKVSPLNWSRYEGSYGRNVSRRGPNSAAPTPTAATAPTSTAAAAASLACRFSSVMPPGSASIVASTAVFTASKASTAPIVSASTAHSVGVKWEATAATPDPPAIARWIRQFSCVRPRKASPAKAARKLLLSRLPSVANGRSGINFLRLGADPGWRARLLRACALPFGRVQSHGRIRGCAALRAR